MSCLIAIRFVLTVALLTALAPLRATAQDDPDEIPLGDAARNLRKKTPATPIIDDDNLPQVMQQADAHHDFGQNLRFLMAGKRRGFQVEAPDVTCSLSFTANVKALLAGQYAEMELPPAEMAKIQGKAVLEGDALSVPVFNGTQWHLSEITVVFTLVRKAGSGSGQTDMSSTDPVHGAPVRNDLEIDPFEQIRPEKKPDTTLIYRMRAAATPWSDAVFSAPLNMQLAPGEEWYWGIVQAKGYPPERYVSNRRSISGQPAAGNPIPSAMSLKSKEVEDVGPSPPQPHE
jgi:hypothetical protein